MNNLVMLMGGSGTRFGANIPKQYIEINGVPVFGYILKKYDILDEIDNIVVVSNKDFIEYVEEWVKKLNLKKVVGVVRGGENRSSSIKNGLEFLKPTMTDEDVILFHDATHPYVDYEGTKKVIEAIRNFGGATLASYNYDTVYRKNEDDTILRVEPRSLIVAGASPEGFMFNKIYDIYMNASEEELDKMTSAGAIALANNIDMKVIESEYLNLKITYKRDMLLFEKLLDNYFFEDFDYEKIKK